jgi:hypothetical protein
MSNDKIKKYLIELKHKHNLTDDSLQYILDNIINPKPVNTRPHGWISVGIEGDDIDAIFYTKYDITDWIRREITDEEWSKFYNLLEKDIDKKYGPQTLLSIERRMEHGVIEIHWDEAFPYKNKQYWWDFRDHFWHIVARLITYELNLWIDKDLGLP